MFTRQIMDGVYISLLNGSVSTKNCKKLEGNSIKTMSPTQFFLACVPKYMGTIYRQAPSFNDYSPERIYFSRFTKMLLTRYVLAVEMTVYVQYYRYNLSYGQLSQHNL